MSVAGKNQLQPTDLNTYIRQMGIKPTAKKSVANTDDFNDEDKNKKPVGMIEVNPDGGEFSKVGSKRSKYNKKQRQKSENSENQNTNQNLPAMKEEPPSKPQPAPVATNHIKPTTPTIPLATTSSKQQASSVSSGYVVDREKQCMALVARGKACVDASDYDGAITYYTNAIDINPNLVSLYTNRSFCYLQVKKFDQAQYDAEHAILLKPDCFIGHYRLGMVLQEKELFVEAEKAFETVLKYDKDGKAAVTELIKCRMQRLVKLGIDPKVAYDAIIKYQTPQAALDGIFAEAEQRNVATTAAVTAARSAEFVVKEDDYDIGEEIFISDEEDEISESTSDTVSIASSTGYHPLQNNNPLSLFNAPMTAPSITGKISLAPFGGIPLGTGSDANLSFFSAGLPVRPSVQPQPSAAQSIVQNPVPQTIAKVVASSGPPKPTEPVGIPSFFGGTIKPPITTPRPAPPKPAPVPAAAASTNGLDPKYDPANPEGYSSLWVGSISNDTTEEQIRECFEPHGKILSIHFKETTPEFKCCFVNFATPSDASHCLVTLQGALVNERRIKVRFPLKKLPPITEQMIKKQAGYKETATPAAAQPKAAPVVVPEKKNNFGLPAHITPKLNPVNPNSLLRPVNGNECAFWRAAGCRNATGCRFQHVQRHKGADLKK